MSEENYEQNRLDVQNLFDEMYTIALQDFSKDGDVLSRVSSSIPQYYDSLDAMIMALESGDIGRAKITDSVADYLVSRNDKLAKYIQSANFDMNNAEGISKLALAFMTNSFSFLMKEDNTQLRDAFNTAIEEMEKDGTLESLTKSYIDDVIAGKEPEAVAFEKFDGEAVKVAVTGSLPPLDYVAPDGTPSGYNTAILSEIGKRIGKTIELVQVDSIGRATALSSGVVDAAFWTRTWNDFANTSAEIITSLEEMKSTLSAEQASMIDEMIKKLTENSSLIEDFAKRDIPDGTIYTRSYYKDMINMVVVK